MRVGRPTRREFAAASLAVCATRVLRAQSASSAHASVAAMERSRVLADAKLALNAPVRTVTSIPAPRGTPGDFVSEVTDNGRVRVGVGGVLPFRAHARALLDFSTTVATLAAAYVLTTDDSYAARAAMHLNAWFVDAATRMSPAPDLAGSLPGTATPNSDGIMDLVPLAEVARASSFLGDSPAFSPEHTAAMSAWFAAFIEWLGATRQMLLARDAKDHRGSAWLLLNTAIARSQRDDKALDDCRRRFRRPTLRNQIVADGHFPQEVATPNPYRNTLMNFDLLAGACQLLTTPFDDQWNYELQDGPGMRSVAAFLYPLIADRNKWPFVSDAEHFRELPGRRPALLFAGRAFSQSQYVDLWRSLPAAVPPDLAASFPIREPLLWTARAPHGL